MIRIGMFDSPAVRRVAVSVGMFGMPFEHRNWSVGEDAGRTRPYNEFRDSYAPFFAPDSQTP